MWAYRDGVDLIQSSEKKSHTIDIVQKTEVWVTAKQQHLGKGERGRQMTF